MYKYIFIMLLLIGLASCVNTKKHSTHWIPKKQILYKDSLGQERTPPLFLREKELVKGTIAQIEDKKGHLKITFVSDSLSKRIEENGYKVDMRPIKDYIYFPNHSQEEKKIKQSKSNRFIQNGAALNYWGMQPVLQALTVPIKVRPALNDQILYNASSSVNVGFAVGYKFTHYAYQNHYQKIKEKLIYINSRTRSYSITPGIFAGPTIVSLTGKNTEGIVKIDRSVLGLTTGGFGVFGIGNFNLGLAIGWDFSFGEEGSKWIYNRKPWYGVVVALDFFK